MTPKRTPLKVHPIDATELEQVRRRRRDQWHNTPEELLSDGGDQLRCCLRLSRPGERLWVVAHAPLTVQRPWREVGPVFVHAHGCQGYDAARGLPDFVSGQPRVLRSYSADGAMYYAGNRVTGGDDDLAAILQELFADPRVAEVHLRNLGAQCFIARVTR